MSGTAMLMFMLGLVVGAYLKEILVLTKEFLQNKVGEKIKTKKEQEDTVDEYAQVDEMTVFDEHTLILRETFNLPLLSFPDYKSDFSAEVELDDGTFLGQFGAEHGEDTEFGESAIEIWMFDIWTSKTTSFFITKDSSHTGVKHMGSIVDISDPEVSSNLYLNNGQLRLKIDSVEIKSDEEKRINAYNIQISIYRSKRK